MRERKSSRHRLSEAPRRHPSVADKHSCNTGRCQVRPGIKVPICCYVAGAKVKPAARQDQS